MKELGGILNLQINRDRSLTDVALTLTHLLEKNMVTTYDAGPEIHIMANTEVVKLLSTQDRTRVIGVQTRKRTQEDHATITLQADLVVDASGRHSQAPQG